MHKRQGWPQTWEYCQQSRLKHLGELHKEWTEAGVSESRVTTLRHLLKQKLHQKHLKWDKEKKNYLHLCKTIFSSPKSSFQIKVHSFGNQGLEKDWRGTESKLLEVQCEVSEVSDDLGCRDVCWCWFIVFYQVQSQFSRLLSILCLHLLTSFMEMLISFSRRTLAPAHSAKSTSKWFADHDIIVLDWPDNMPDLNPILNLWDIFKRKKRNSGSNNTDELKAVPQAAALESSDTGWSLPCHTSLMLEFVLKEPRPSTECRNKYTLKNLNFSVLQILFLIDLGNILIFWDTDFWLSWAVSSNHQN